MSSPTTAWPPTLIEWAFTTLPRHLGDEDQGELAVTHAAWQRRQLAALRELGGQERVAALAEIDRVNWRPELEADADRLQVELLRDAQLDELFAFAEIVLESGLLRLVEQSEQSVEDTLRLFGQELVSLDAVRRELRGRCEEARARGVEPRLRLLLRRTRALARRLRNQSDEAVLHRRLVRIFGERGVRWFSRVSLVALLALLGLILVDLLVPPALWWQTFVFWADTSICFLFLWEFVWRLALAPRKHVWFLRHFLTDLVPAIPFALLLHPGPGEASAAAGAEFLVRSVRLVRIPVYVRSLRFLKPAVAAFRMLVFGLRGLDRLVQGLAPVLNREIVFFEREGRPPQSEELDEGEEARVTRRFLRLSPEKRTRAAPKLVARLRLELERYEGGAAALRPYLQSERRSKGAGATMLPVEDAIEHLRGLTAETVEERLPPDIVRSLGRLLRAFDLPVLRWLPLLGRLVRNVHGDTASERVASAGRVIGAHFQNILGFIHGWADLAGVVTAPQILDRVGTALAKSTQRPAVRLLLFGSLFLLARLVIEGLFGITLSPGLRTFLQRFVYGPLLIVGIGALLLLLLARWLKRIAGEATERLERLSEARYANLMELVHRRNEEDDRSELVARVHRSRGKQAAAERIEIAIAMEELRGRLADGPISQVSSRARRLALLLLDAQDGGFLHVTNQKTTEQFLAHPDLWILRQRHLGLGRKEQRRLQRLDLENGGLFSGPHFWFEQITHAVSIKVARLCSTYNLHALPLEARESASADDLARHRALCEGSDELPAEPWGGVQYKSSFFHVLHFLTPDRIWLEEVERAFGSEMRERLVTDRQRLVRGIFGTRPLHELPRDLRSFNPFHFYTGRLSGGRFLLLPFKLFFAWLRLVWTLGRVAVKSVREILDPKKARGERSPFQAPFAVAQRKLRRMKKPLLHEAMQLLGRVDPAYFGLDAAGSRLEQGLFGHDLELLDPTPPERRAYEELRERSAARLLYFADFAKTLDSAPVSDTPAWQRLFSAFAADEQGLALFGAAPARARAWRAALAAGDEEAPGALPDGGRRTSAGLARRGLERMLDALGVSERAQRQAFRRALRKKQGDLPLVAFAYGLAGEAGPEAKARALAAQMRGDANAFVRCLETARAVLALIVFDLRHHERLVHEIGAYEEPPPATPSYVLEPEAHADQEADLDATPA